ncbi:hypothetical protein [Pseudovibrio sp. SCP19]|uniref:hypothetical protein n=1 Tax=Pseudovibrio sp. SCP19 TaxID=3141374 RepID=UPI00333734D0
MMSSKNPTYYPTTFRNPLMATIVWAQLFVLYCITLLAFSTQNESHVLWADPFIKIIPIYASTWLVILTSLLLGWYCFKKLGWAGLKTHTPVTQIIAGAGTAVIVTCIIWSIFGSKLPDFVPAEESSRPGFLFGMVAGYGEELLFRMLISAPVFFGMFRLLAGVKHSYRVFWSALTAVLIAAIAFVVFHELGETDHTLMWNLIATRMLVPGLIMGSLFFLLGPGFVIFMHASMHIMIPLLFN